MNNLIYASGSGRKYQDNIQWKKMTIKRKYGSRPAVTIPVAEYIPKIFSAEFISYNIETDTWKEVE